MGDITGFMKHRRETPTRRPIPVRVHDWREVYEPFPGDNLRTQASRCMNCGIPFCHSGCPLGNLIPEWNDLVWREDWKDASERLHATNNFPEFTGRLCPAPCESACVLGINDDPVTIKQVEVTIVERHLAETGSQLAARILADWDTQTWLKVFPKDFKRVLAAIARAEAEGLDVDKVVMEAAHG